jgi:glycosyltransferase involved in cell wall biosynthesis
MKVAFVIHDFDANFGQGRYGIEIARRLAHRCEFVVISNTFNAPQLPNVRWVRVPACRFNVVTTVLSFIPAAERAVRREAPDVIHAQGLTCWSSDVITGHICNAARSRSLAVTRPTARWFIRLITPLERAFYRHPRASHLIAISQSLAREIQEEYGWNRQVSVLHHGTNTEQFRPVASPEERNALQTHFKLPQDRWLWLFMGEAVKGLRQVIEQLSFFPKAHLLVVSRSNFLPYKAQASAAGVLDRIQFWGYEPHPENAFRAADVFVYPSDYDPFGMVGGEAMASGLPVVVGKTIGVAELIQDGENGLLCNPEDPRSISSQLRRLQDEPNLARKLSTNGRESMMQTSWDHNADEVFRIYQDIARSRPKP